MRISHIGHGMKIVSCIFIPIYSIWHFPYQYEVEERVIFHMHFACMEKLSFVVVACWMDKDWICRCMLANTVSMFRDSVEIRCEKYFVFK